MPDTLVKLGQLWLCKGDQCQGCESPPHLSSSLARTVWLRGFKSDAKAMADLRRTVRDETSGPVVSHADDDAVIARIARLIDRGQLRICSAIDLNDRKAPTQHGGGLGQSVDERVIRNLKTKDQPFSFEGMRLQVIRAKQLPAFRGDQRYQIIHAGDARQILSRIAALPTVSGNEKTALEQAVSLVSDNTDGGAENGLLLLRITPLRYANAGSSEPALTPSQLAKLTQTHWIEIELVDEDGHGVAGAKYSIVAADTQEYTGATDSNGRARVDRLVAGQCKVSFPELDGHEWRGS